MEPVDDIADAFVEQAFAREARIVHLSDPDERARLAAPGGGVGIGALPRYAVGSDAHR